MHSDDTRGTQGTPEAPRRYQTHPDGMKGDPKDTRDDTDDSRGIKKIPDTIRGVLSAVFLFYRVIMSAET